MNWKALSAQVPNKKEYKAFYKTEKLSLEFTVFPVSYNSQFALSVIVHDAGEEPLSVNYFWYSVEGAKSLAEKVLLEYTTLIGKLIRR